MELGFVPRSLTLGSLVLTPPGLWSSSADQKEGDFYKKCRNYSDKNACNWMIPSADSENYCLSCRLNHTIPDLSIEKNRRHWALIENAKRRLIYTLLSLNLPLLNKAEDPQRGLSFQFLVDGSTPESKVLTGHMNGIITINVAEADDSERERRRVSMKEPYRTLLGHFRHEIGHYYWDRLVSGSKYLTPYRKIFGDEQADYQESLARYYNSTPPDQWQNEYISMYASAHPWEDWAETWAHYLHIQDTLEVALNFGLIDKRLALESKGKRSLWYPSKQKTFEEKIAAWSELTIALNSINRSMGLQDLYPFILTPRVVEKLRFVSDVITGR